MVQKVLDNAGAIEHIADRFAHSENALYLGRGYQFPVALEGALKLKEISYIHAEGYPAAEMKHGPIALIDEAMPVVFIANQDEVYEKVVSNIQEVKPAEAKSSPSSPKATKKSLLGRHVLEIPKVDDALTPLLTVVLCNPELPHCPQARMQRGPATQPREKRHRGMNPAFSDHNSTKSAMDLCQKCNLGGPILLSFPSSVLSCTRKT